MTSAFPSALPSVKSPSLVNMSISLWRDPWTIFCEEHVIILEKVQVRATAVTSQSIEKSAKASREMLVEMRTEKQGQITWGRETVKCKGTN